MTDTYITLDVQCRVKKLVNIVETLPSCFDGALEAACSCVNLLTEQVMPLIRLLIDCAVKVLESPPPAAALVAAAADTSAFVFNDGWAQLLLAFSFSGTSFQAESFLVLYLTPNIQQ